MKKYFNRATLIAVIVLLVSVVTGFIVLSSSLNKYKELYNRALNNERIYEEMNSGLELENKQFQLTINELNQSKDSINQKLSEAIKDLKIKDKKIKSLEYQMSNFKKTDTITIRDSVIVNKLDTTLGNEWYTMRLALLPPNTVITEPSFKSEKYIITHLEKEYLDKPSNIFFIRWFQKKREVMYITVEEKSPYIVNSNNRFIEIVH